MAMYEYRCPTCDARFELRRPMSDSSEPATCPEGHVGAVRLLSVFASVSSGASDSSSASAFGGGGPCGPACACHPG
ncbi:MAG TPA: zinc ribbon domain-containing protein [Acidimicrobiales bacterium]|nr:zinc ribbon domain-containing protein [Acidimicrobiales bacterium]